MFEQGSPRLVDDSGCTIIIEFFTKEACLKDEDKTAEIPCVVFDDVNKRKIDLSPLIKLSGLSSMKIPADKFDIS